MKKILLLMSAVIVILSLSLMFVSCERIDTDNPDENETGKESALETEANVPEEKEGLYLKTLSFDDANYAIKNFDPEVTEYNVALPQGNARVPQIVATAKEGITVVIAQADMTKEQESGTANVTISDAEGNTKVYTINMKRDISGGFVLCVGDEWQFELGYLQTQYREGYTYESSNPDVLSVDENGLMKALKETNEEITVVAKLDGKLTDSFVIDRIEKAE